MIVKAKSGGRVPSAERERIKKNQVLSDLIELFGDISDMEKAKSVKGKNITLDQYLAKRGLSTRR